MAILILALGVILVTIAVALPFAFPLSFAILLIGVGLFGLAVSAWMRAGVKPLGWHDYYADLERVVAEDKTISKEEWEAYKRRNGWESASAEEETFEQHGSENFIVKPPPYDWNEAE